MPLSPPVCARATRFPSKTCPPTSCAASSASPASASSNTAHASPSQTLRSAEPARRRAHTFKSGAGCRDGVIREETNPRNQTKKKLIHETTPNSTKTTWMLLLLSCREDDADVSASSCRFASRKEQEHP